MGACDENDGEASNDATAPRQIEIFNFIHNFPYIEIFCFFLSASNSYPFAPPTRKSVVVIVVVLLRQIEKDGESFAVKGALFVKRETIARKQPPNHMCVDGRCWGEMLDGQHWI